MEIEPATYADSWGIEELLMGYQEEVIATNPKIFFRGIDREKLTSVVVSDIDNARINIIVARHNGDVIGFLRLTEIVHFFTKVITIEMDMIFISPSFRSSLLGGRVFVKFMDEFMRWGDSRKADILCISSLSGLNYEKMNKTIGKFGFDTVGFISLKRIGF